MPEPAWVPWGRDPSQLRNDAMWAIFSHCHVARRAPAPRPPRMPARLAPLGIPEAIQVLVAAPDGLARRWRALVRLLSAQLHRSPDAATRSALAELARSVDIDLRAFDGATSERAVLATFAQILHGLPDPHACKTLPLGTDVLLPEPNVTRSTARCQVRRSIADLRKPCDAQSWDDCSQAFLDATKVFIVGAGWVDTQVPRGTPWAGQFFERVYADFTWRSLLNMHYQPHYAPNEIFLAYSLYRSIDVRLGFFLADAPILRDRGYLHAVNHGGPWTEVTAVKEIKYADLTPFDASSGFDWGLIFNYLAPPLLGYWLESGLLESLCCNCP